jgi:hypothetical protein
LGSDDEKQKTKEAIRDLLNVLIGDLPMAILDWRGDGGLIICDVRDGFQEVIVRCQKLWDKNSLKIKETFLALLDDI